MVVSLYRCSGFLVGGTGSLSGAPGGSRMKTVFSSGAGGMWQSGVGVPHGAVASGGGMRTWMAVRGARQHGSDGVSIANDMDPEEFDGNFIFHATIPTYHIQNRNF